jgi:hypothetical protein
LRYVPHFRDYLAAADEFAWACYRPVQEALVAGGTLAKSEVREPALVCFSSVASPFSIPRGVSYLGELEGGSPRDRITRQIVLSLPIPIVAVPWYQIQHLPDALVLGHEVGHVVERDARLEEQVRQLITGAAAGVPERYGTSDDWRRWSSEAFADVYGALCGGPAFMSALSDFLLVPAARQAAGTGEYPPAGVRLALVLAALRAAGPDGARSGGGGQDALLAVEERWRQEGAEIRQVKEAPAVADAVAYSRHGQLGNQRLADLMPFSKEQLKATAKALLDSDPVTTRDTRVLMAAAAWAYADEPQRYQAADVPGQVLERVLEIADPGARETSATRGSDGARADAMAASKLHEILVRGSTA